MKAKIKIKLFKRCEIPGCNDKAVCGISPKNRMEKTIHICQTHRKKHDDPKDSFSLWEIWNLPKPMPKRKLQSIPEKKKVNHRTSEKPKWQEVLDRWFAKGQEPKPGFMNSKRWDYWMSISSKEKVKDYSKKGNGKKKLHAKVRRKK